MPWRIAEATAGLVTLMVVEPPIMLRTPDPEVALADADIDDDDIPEDSARLPVLELVAWLNAELLLPLDWVVTVTGAAWEACELLDPPLLVLVLWRSIAAEIEEITGCAFCPKQ
jgi:hypothetical protein